MRKNPFFASLLVLAVALGRSIPVQAAQFDVSIAGSLGSSENSCTQIIPFFTLTGCTYGNDRVSSGGWVGPELFGAHYGVGTAGDSVTHPFAPGDGRISPALTGTVSIDDNGTPGNGGDDFIAAEFVIGAAARNVITAQGRQSVERWTSMIHAMDPTAVNAGTANALGGFDYVIGLHGFPQLLCSALDSSDCFASANAPIGIPTLPSFWSGFEPNGIGIERNAVQGGNIGATTTAVFEGYSCSEQPLSGDCANSLVLWGAGENPGFDNLLLRIVTNGAGQIVDANGYWTQEWRIAFQATEPGDNSWAGGTMQFTGQVVPVPAAAWLLGSALAGLGCVRRIRRSA